MNVLHSILKVSFTPLGANSETEAEQVPKSKTNRLKVVSRQLLKFRLTVICDNEAGDAEKAQATKAFLAMVGVHSLETAWAYLFSAVQVVPFFLCKPTTSFDQGTRPSPLQPKATSLSPSPGPDLLANIRNNFMFGTPAFWLNHTYTRTARDTETRENVHGSLGSASPAETYIPNFPLSMVDLQTSMPYVSNTASPSFANSAMVSRTPRGGHTSLPDISGLGGGTGSAGADVRCEVIGTVQTVTADEAATAATRSTAPGARGTGATPTEAALPKRLESSFTVDLALPDLEAAALRGMDTTLAMVVLLPLCPGSAHLGVPVDPDQPAILRSVLARSVGQFAVETAGAAALVLGSGVVPVEFTEPFLCLSSTSPLSNDRLVLNLSLTNVTACAARLYSTSLDLHSSCVLRDADTQGGDDFAGGASAAASMSASPLWGELRPGANLSSMRTIDLLAKLVTITPVVVGEERPPFVLHPGETYSFEFVIEVLPQLCYLLNSQSLEYLYERYYAVPHGMTSRARFDGGGGGGSAAGAAATRFGSDGNCATRSGAAGTPGSASRGGASAVFSNGSVVTDCYGATVSANELRSLLSYSYVSHLFVYYDLVSEDSTATSLTSLPDVMGSETVRRSEVAGRTHGTGLYLRYPAQWSFGA